MENKELSLDILHILLVPFPFLKSYFPSILKRLNNILINSKKYIFNLIGPW